MSIDHHESFRHMIDESLAGTISAEREQRLRQHLDICAPCQEYLSASNRVIASLGGLSFEVDPTLNAKVLTSLRIPAEPRRQRWALISVVAAALTMGGFFVDLQFGRLIASVFDIQRMPVHYDLLSLWIVPSLCVFFLFPLLPLLSKPRSYRKERSL